MVFFVASDRFDDAAVAKSRGVGAMVLRARASDCRTGNLMGIFWLVLVFGFNCFNG